MESKKLCVLNTFHDFDLLMGKCLLVHHREEIVC